MLTWLIVATALAIAAPTLYFSGRRLWWWVAQSFEDYLMEKVRGEAWYQASLHYEYARDDMKWIEARIDDIRLEQEMLVDDVDALMDKWLDESVPDFYSDDFVLEGTD